MSQAESQSEPLHDNDMSQPGSDPLQIESLELHGKWNGDPRDPISVKAELYVSIEQYSQGVIQATATACLDPNIHA